MSNNFVLGLPFTGSRGNSFAEAQLRSWIASPSKAPVPTVRVSLAAPVPAQVVTILRSNRIPCRICSPAGPVGHGTAAWWLRWSCPPNDRLWNCRRLGNGNSRFRAATGMNKLRPDGGTVPM